MAATLPSGFQQTTWASIPAIEATSMVFVPGGRYLYYTEKKGPVRVIKDGVLQDAPLLRTLVGGRYERGMESIELDPNFATNGFFYVFYTKPDPSSPSTTPPDNAKNRVSQFKVNLNDPTKLDTSFPERVLLDNMSSESGFHNGGSLHFGADGMLYVGVGEAGSPVSGQTTSNAQDLSNLSGKILRINPAAYPNIVPADNPFVGQAGKRPEIWAYGLRNPFTSAIKPGTNLLFANDVGSSKFEEVNQIEKGKNYGYPKAEGYSTDPTLASPIYAYAHGAGQSAITGGVFYNGSNFPAQFKDQYFFSDYTKRWVKVLNPATKQVTDFGTGTESIVDLDVGPDGALYALAPYVGKILRFSYVGAGANRAPTGVAKADVTSGGTPLTVKFSAAGSADPDGDALTYAWDFGDGTTGTGRDVTHTYTKGGTFDAKLTVSDGKGGTDAPTPIKVSVGNRAPVGTITAPAATLFYDAGQTINLAATGTDPEDGNLGASAFKWSIVLHHLDHTHPFIDDLTGPAASFVIPVDVEVDPRQFFRVHLVTTDSEGLSSEKTVDIQPRAGGFKLASNVPGIKLNLEGAPQDAPATIAGVAGAVRQLGAPATQVVNGVTYRFTGWSDGGAAVHNITTPADANTTYTANYVPAVAATGGLLGTYYDNADFTGASVTRTDATVNFNWAAGAPIAGIAADTFSVRWTGKVTPTATGDWTFYALANDGVRVTINGQTVIDDLAATGIKDRTSAAIPLTAGQAYDLVIEYFDNTNTASVQFAWSGPGVAREVVPTSALTPPGAVGNPPPQTARRALVPWASAPMSAPAKSAAALATVYRAPAEASTSGSSSTDEDEETPVVV